MFVFLRKRKREREKNWFFFKLDWKISIATWQPNTHLTILKICNLEIYLHRDRYLKNASIDRRLFSSWRKKRKRKRKEKKRKEKKRERRRHLLDPGIMVALPWSDLKKTASSVFREHSVSSIYIIIYRKEQRRGEIVYDATRSSLGNSLPLLSNSHSSQNENHINSFSTLHYRTRWKQFRREKKIIPLPRTESVHKSERNNSLPMPPSSRSNFPRNRNIIISNPSKIFNHSARQNFTLCTLYFPLSASSASFPGRWTDWDDKMYRRNHRME